MGPKPEWTLLLMEFWTYAVRDPHLREELAARHLRVLEAGAQMLEDAADEMGETPLIPPLGLSRAASAMAHGVALERLVDPDGVPEELLETMFAMFFREATAPEAHPDDERETEGPSEQRGGKESKPSRE